MWPAHLETTPKFRAATPQAVEAAMEQFATDLGPTGRDEQYGFGLINPRASLRGLGLAK